MELRSYAYAFTYIAELPEFPINKVFMETVFLVGSCKKLWWKCGQS
jgi:hypothetical protein